MSGFGSVVPFLVMVVWLGLLIYGIVLATRFVVAIEQIAVVLSTRLPRKFDQ